ncbi:hypothetical protein [Microlunatus soli]|uniref:Glyoxalase-like domain-containing protein n=1 Tax=Microlunatus soli TaxID=630515 RepID=A0A1H1RQM2_9ACTN|nr:hypothetical protein [Microlunatus soli]SDS37856.1 hypothetical protein SAMN04489812_1730 [Microlunatus soli]
MMTTDQDQTQPTAQTLEVSAFRFSTDPPAVGGFLQLLGLSQRIGNDAGTWLELQAEQGSVSIHATRVSSTADAQSGSTDLVLVAHDVPAFADRMRTRDGFQVEVWDEAFGHQASVAIGGRTMIINEIQPDPYGYQVTDPTPGPVTVITHWHTVDPDSAEALLAALGLHRSTRPATADEIRWESASHGAVVLHRVTAAEDAPDCYRIGLETDDDLAAVADRLRADGHRVQISDDGHRLDLTDPDGQPLEVTRR